MPARLPESVGSFNAVLTSPGGLVPPEGKIGLRVIGPPVPNLPLRPGKPAGGVTNGPGKPAGGHQARAIFQPVGPRAGSSR